MHRNFRAPATVAGLIVLGALSTVQTVSATTPTTTPDTTVAETTTPDTTVPDTTEAVPATTEAVATTEVVHTTTAPELVARPLPFVVAQHVLELDGATSLQWQAIQHSYDADGEQLEATANLFLFSDVTLAMAAQTPPLGGVLTAPDEVIAVPAGSNWHIRALDDTPVPATLFGLGHEAGGTAPVGDPFTVGTSGWYQLEVRAYQLAPGEFAEVGDGATATLLIGRLGVTTTAAGDLAAGQAASVDRSEVVNHSDEPVELLAATVTEIPADVAALLPAAPAPAAPATTTPAEAGTTAAPAGTSAPATTAAPAPAPETTASGAAPTAADDSFSNDGDSVSGNVLDNDDLGNPPAVIVSVDGSAGNVGTEYSVGNGLFRLDADGSATFDVTLVTAGATYTYSVAYVIENEHGQSSAVATFVVNG